MEHDFVLESVGVLCGSIAWIVMAALTNSFQL